VDLATFNSCCDLTQSRGFLHCVIEKFAKQVSHRHIELGGADLQCPVHVDRQVERQSFHPTARTRARLCHGGNLLDPVRVSVSTDFSASVCQDRPYGFALRLASHPPRMVTLVDEGAPMQVKVGHRVLRGTAAFSSYWELAAERQRIFYRRLRREKPPWTDDPVLAAHRFTNAYRASDRVSQVLINDVIYGSCADERSTVLRVLLFKIFNRVDTWRYLEQSFGPITADSFDAVRLSELLDVRMAKGERLYSAAYIMPSPKLGEVRKHANHLRLLDQLLVDGTIDELVDASSLKDLYSTLADIHSFGPFLAFQFAIDLNYSDLYAFSEMDFVVAGPGAHDGIAKCFVDTDDLSAEDVIRAVTDGAAGYFDEAGIEFESLWGRPLQLIDCQNLFCEVDKYSRVVHPELQGPSGRTQIKQRYLPSGLPVKVGYPPKWGLCTASTASAEWFEHDGAFAHVAHHPSTVGRSNLSPHGEPAQDRLFYFPEGPVFDLELGSHDPYRFEHGVVDVVDVVEPAVIACMFEEEGNHPFLDDDRSSAVLDGVDEFVGASLSVEDRCSR
jgi:5-hmdU DNA kinase-like protein